MPPFQTPQGAVLYAVSNVAQERLLLGDTPVTELLAAVGGFGAAIGGVQVRRGRRGRGQGGERGREEGRGRGYVPVLNKLGLKCRG